MNRKIFRMGYEPCKGDCYCYDDVLPVDDLDPEKRQAVIKKLLELHAPMCGNEALRYGVDFSEELRLFVGFFYHYGATETFVSSSAGCHNPQVPGDLQARPGLLGVQQVQEPVRVHEGVGLCRGA